MVSLLAEAVGHSSDFAGHPCHPCQPWKWRLARIVSEVVRWLHCMFSKQVYVWMACVGKTVTHHCHFAAHSHFISRQNSTQPCTVLQLRTFPWLCLHVFTDPHSCCALCTCSNASHRMVSKSRIERLLQGILAILHFARIGLKLARMARIISEHN